MKILKQHAHPLSNKRLLLTAKYAVLLCFQSKIEKVDFISSSTIKLATFRHNTTLSSKHQLPLTSIWKTMHIEKLRNDHPSDIISDFVKTKHLQVSLGVKRRIASGSSAKTVCPKSAIWGLLSFLWLIYSNGENSDP